MSTSRMPSTRLPRDYWLRHIETLDPEAHWAEIFGVASGHEFPWDSQRAAELALFRTFAVPEIGRLLFETGEFTERTMKRVDDTVILLEEAGDFITGESADRTAVQRLNRMHGAYDIPNDQMLYVLTTFVVANRRWIDRFGYRPLTEREVHATVRYWQRMGEVMGVNEIPEDYEAFERYYDDYERTRFGFTPEGRAVAEATMGLLAGDWPAPLRPLVRALSIALLDANVREALRLEAPHPAARLAVQAGMGLRKAIVRRLPARRDLLRPSQSGLIRGYPGGWDTSRLGTFPARAASRTV